MFDRYYALDVKNPGDDYPSRIYHERPADGSEPIPPKKGKVIVIDRDLLDGIRALLDGASCTPYVYYTPAAVKDIVYEEVSAYLDGGSDADGCVKYIQSRVSIWLAEHN